MERSSRSNKAAHQRSQSAYVPGFPQQKQTSPLYAPSSAPFDAMAVGHFAKNNPGALGELQHNQQEAAPRLNRNAKNELAHERGRSQSPVKSSRFPLPSDIANKAKSRDNSPIKKKKSGTGFSGFLSRPKSLKNLYKLSTDEAQQVKDKENKEPQSAGPPPIYAQFSSDQSWKGGAGDRSSAEAVRSPEMAPPQARPNFKERPKSFQIPMMSNNSSATSLSPKKTSLDRELRKDSGDKAAAKSQRGRMMNAIGTFAHKRTKSEATSPATTPPIEQALDPKDIDKHLEAMLDRRNIPENQRYKMRNLNDTIKMEFIRQDWAEMQAAKAERPGTHDSFNSVDEIAVGSDAEDDKDKLKRTRGRSFTFSRGKKDNSSPKKSRGEGTLGRHFRSRSTDSVASERPSSAASSQGTGILSKIKLQQGPSDYVGYLRKVRKPELVEVGKLHKLRLLLRNETVAWIEDFIQQGGMKEIVGLLERVMEVEWREEHEDALLHENLLCLKALSTTAKGMQYLDTIHSTLFPKLLGMLFDPERKGPSEFTTRNIITSVLFAYIQSAPPAERTTRAHRVLSYLRDPEPKEDERPLPFVLEMRQERPYRVWCKEIVSVTKEVFWIFLHNLNVVALPSDKGFTPIATGTALPPGAETENNYMTQHFPHERPPVPAAPYVGGVEWDATNYLATHLDLMNAILACTPQQGDRNRLRAEFRISGLERCMGGSLRLCKEKFYGSVHDGLRTWVAAAADDGWEIKDVRYGPPPESRASPKKNAGGQKKENAPKIEIPKLDLGLDKGQPSRDAWL